MRENVRQYDTKNARDRKEAWVLFDAFVVNIVMTSHATHISRKEVARLHVILDLDSHIQCMSYDACRMSCISYKHTYDNVIQPHRRYMPYLTYNYIRWQRDDRHVNRPYGNA